MKPKLLDLYCGAGGAAAGYAKAGFDVTGVDIKPQPNYPYKFIQADALGVLKNRDFINEFDVIHASPPCQAYSKAKGLSEARNNGKYGEHPDLIALTRELLIKTG
ncbi:DNA cytosine methyltransferase, partial [Candidatus Bathyarchaeota archaeon]|nr:DNA cytosine methyltransferase [Candidatus Bathyarchaeota archaeon]